MFDQHADVIKVNTRYVPGIVITMPLTTRLLQTASLLHHCRCISDIWYRCTYQSRRRAVVITDARRVKRYSGDISHKQIITLSLFRRRPTPRWPQLQCPGQLSQRWTLPLSVGPVVLLNVVNMESLLRSSETAEQGHISERTWSQRRNVETIEQTAARLLAQRDYARCQRSCEN